MTVAELIADWSPPFADPYESEETTSARNKQTASRLALREAFIAVAAGPSRRLAAYFQKNKGNVMGGFAIQLVGERCHAKKWRVGKPKRDVPDGNDEERTN